MKGFFVLFAVTIAAEFTVQYTDLPVPSSIVGMVGLAIWFTLRKGVEAEIQEASQTLLRLLALLLVPVGVAVVDLFSSLDGALMTMVAISVAALILATFSTVATIFFAQWVTRHRRNSAIVQSQSRPHTQTH
jgi:holin-like protein